MASPLSKQNCANERKNVTDSPPMATRSHASHGFKRKDDGSSVEWNTELVVVIFENPAPATETWKR
jgi:hypothetical protein